MNAIGNNTLMPWQSVSSLLGLFERVTSLLEIRHRHWLCSGRTMHNGCFLVSLMDRNLGVSDRRLDHLCSDD